MTVQVPEKAAPLSAEIADKDISLTFAKGMEVLEAFDKYMTEKLPEVIYSALLLIRSSG